MYPGVEQPQLELVLNAVPWGHATQLEQGRT